MRTSHRSLLTLCALATPLWLAACGDDGANPTDPTGDTGITLECDGAPETTWYRDDDGDGFGDAANFVIACEPPTGYVSNADDCDDTDEDVYPGAIEFCDGVDTNCDGNVDNVSGPEGDALAWYRDVDGDGYGDPDDRIWACEQPAGYVDNPDDCAPSDPNQPREWAPEVDDAPDCAETVPACEAPDEGWVLVPTWYLDEDLDGFGQASQSVQACDQPDGYAEQPDDCNDDDPLVYPGAPTGCGLRDWNCDGTATNGTFNWYADCDGDGFAASGAAVVPNTCTPPEPTGNCPGGWTVRVPTSSATIDCNDDNANMFPGQLQFFTQSHSPAGTEDERWGNYNCDGVASRQHIMTGASVPSSSECEPKVNPKTWNTVLCDGPSGWESASGQPSCGMGGTWSTCRSAEVCAQGDKRTECQPANATLLCMGNPLDVRSPCFCLRGICPAPSCTPGSRGCPWVYAYCPSRSVQTLTQACR